MELRAAELGRELARGLAPLYLVSGDESLLVQEACDAIVAAARAAGFAERTVLHAETAFQLARRAAGVRQLVTVRRAADHRRPRQRRGLRPRRRRGADAVCAAAGRGHAAPRPFGPARGEAALTAWYKTVAQAGVVLTIWPISAAELPRWLEGRLQAAGLRLSRDALQALAQRVEGNLLAAVQEIEKLKLHELPQPIALEDLLAVLEDAARYDSFELIDGALAGDAARVSRMIVNLRQEGWRSLRSWAH